MINGISTLKLTPLAGRWSHVGTQTQLLNMYKYKSSTKNCWE